MGDDKLIERFSHQVGLAREKVQAVGALCVKSGCLEGTCRRSWVHSEFGPAVQEKDTNQDYVIAWKDRSETEEPKEFWAIVMADGVTSSHRAEWAAELACWTSLARLVELRRNVEARELAMRSIHAAGGAVGGMGDLFRKKPEMYRPDDEFPATWEYILSEGLLLQTTLTLVWWDGCLHIAIVGDGAAAIRELNDGACRIVAGSDFETCGVHAIGPNNRQVAEPDVWNTMDVTMPFSLAVFTDGVGRGVAADASEIFAHADATIEDGEMNPARHVLDVLQQNRPKEFEDNLTLGLMYFDR
jgi:hypothetical protein